MPQKIYYGNAIVRNQKTGQIQTIEGVVFKELDSLTDKFLRSSVLRKFKPPEREYLEITKLCFDTATYLSDTIY